MSSNQEGAGGVPSHVMVEAVSQGHRMRPLECVQHEAACDRRWDEQHKTTKAIEAAVVEHKLRLENGSRVFADLKQEIAGLRVELKEIAQRSSPEIAALRAEVKELAQQAKPKPTPWIAIIGITSTFIFALLGSWWSLSEKLAERPTIKDVQEAIKTHADEPGHAGTEEEIKAMREAQVEQREALKGLVQDVKDIKDDIRALRNAKP